MKLFDVVRSLVERDGIKEGDIGTIVEIWAKEGPFEVEFVDKRSGETYALLTMAESEFEIYKEKSEPF